MSFGFGLGLPHYVAVLGGSGSGYFLSLTTNGAGITEALRPASILLDASGNIIVFGTTDFGAAAGAVIKLTPSGTLSTSSKFSSSDTANTATKDSSGNYYALTDEYQYYCCAEHRFPEIVKLNSSLNKTAGALISVSDTSVPITFPTIDSSGNIWFAYDDNVGTGYSYIMKVNSALTAATFYNEFSVGCCYVYYNTITSNPVTSSLIFAGYFFVFACCPCCGSYYTGYPTVQSVPISAPTTVTWAGGYTGLQSDGFGATAVNSAGDIYLSRVDGALIKLNSSGAVQWKYRFTGAYYIQCIVFDSSNNVYCIATEVGYGIQIFKVQDNGGSATLVYSRRLYSPNGGMSFLALGRYTNIATIDGNTLYLTVAFKPNSTAHKILVLKVPTDGTLTQTVSLSGYSFSYSIGTITQNINTDGITSPGFTAFPMSTPTVPSVENPGGIAPTSLTASTAVTVL